MTGSEAGQNRISLLLMALPLIFCLAVSHFSGMSLLPKLPTQLPSLDSILRSDSPWEELKKAVHLMSAEGNTSPNISAAAHALPSAACRVSPQQLAVLGADGPFARGITGTLLETRLAPHGTELQDVLPGDALKGCIFAAHSDAFRRLTGPKPVVKRLAQKKHAFAHEARAQLSFMLCTWFEVYTACVHAWYQGDQTCCVVHRLASGHMHAGMQASRSTRLHVQGPVWLPAVNRLFFVSNRLGDLETADQHVELWTLDPATLATRRIQPSMPILMANGATNWSPSEVLVTQQVRGCMVRSGMLCMHP